MIARRRLAPPAGALSADPAEVMRYLGYRPGKSQLTPRVEAVVAEGIAVALATAEPQVSAGYCSLSLTEAGVALSVPGFEWRSADLARRLQGAAALSIFVATLGDGPTATLRRRFAAGDYAVATAIDAAATTLLQALLRWAVAAEAADRGLAATSLYSPGYGDWAITDQPAIVAAVGGAVGVTCTPTCYLIPEKSLVAVAGWTAAPGAALPSGCAACHQPACAYRQAPLASRR